MCCESCRKQRQRAERGGDKGCSVWVWCGEADGCNGQKFGECCSDYQSVCLENSCYNKCENAAYDPTRSCQCDPQCARFNECCEDKSLYCISSDADKPSDCGPDVCSNGGTCVDECDNQTVAGASNLRTFCLQDVQRRRSARKTASSHVG